MNQPRIRLRSRFPLAHTVQTTSVPLRSLTAGWLLAAGFVQLAVAQDELPDPAQPTDQAAGSAAAAQRMSYALGLNIGSDLRSSGVQCDIKSLLAGLTDGINGSDPKLSEEDLAVAMQRFQQVMQRKAEAEIQRLAAEHQQRATEFLTKNRGQEGVVETPSGMQYKVLRQGDGPSPTVTDQVKTNYRGTLLDGTEFDSSYRRGEPAIFPVGGVIDGWTEALQKMHVGDKWQLWIPAGLAYGNNPPGPPIEPGQLLVFEIELLAIEK